MKWSIPQLIALLDVEILWCKEHPEKAPTPDFAWGFIAGIKQAQHILKGAEKPTRSHTSPSPASADAARSEVQDE